MNSRQIARLARIVSDLGQLADETACPTLEASARQLDTLAQQRRALPASEGLSPPRRRRRCPGPPLFDALPQGVIEHVLLHCGAPELGTLCSVSRAFGGTPLLPRHRPLVGCALADPRRRALFAPPLLPREQQLLLLQAGWRGPAQLARLEGRARRIGGLCELMRAGAEGTEAGDVGGARVAAAASRALGATFGLSGAARYVHGATCEARGHLGALLAGGGDGQVEAAEAASAALLALTCRPGDEGQENNVPSAYANDPSACAADGCAAVVAAGALAPLVALLRAGVSDVATANAAGTLGNLAYFNDSHFGSGAHCAAIVAAGAVPPLVALLSAADEETAQCAGSTLSHLSYGDDGDHRSCSSIVAAGGARALTAVLASATSSERAKVHAAGVLANLAHAHAARSNAIVAAGAVQQLAALLRTATDEEAGSAAANALANLASASGCAAKDAAGAEGAIAHLVALLSAQGAETRSDAADALADLCQGHAPNQAAAVAAGAIPRLVAALQARAPDGSDEEAVSDAVHALANLAAGGCAIARGMASAGAIPVLVELHAWLPGSAALRAHVEETVRHLLERAGARAPLLAAGGGALLAAATTKQVRKTQ
jgi:hypothetical protein